MSPDQTGLALPSKRLRARVQRLHFDLPNLGSTIVSTALRAERSSYFGLSLLDDFAAM